VGGMTNLCLNPLAAPRAAELSLAPCVMQQTRQLPPGRPGAALPWACQAPVDHQQSPVKCVMCSMS